MKRDNIFSIIFDLSTDRFSIFPTFWFNACYDDLFNLAYEYWENRNEEEVDRDIAANVVFDDYKDWVFASHAKFTQSNIGKYNTIQYV